MRYAPALCIGLLLIFVFRLYTFAYFWIDDFGSFFRLQQQPLGVALGNLVSPSAQYLRPLGMLMYALAFRLFKHDPLPYHLVMWALHSLNVGLVYLTLKRFTESRAGAAVGALLYACPPAFNDIFWSFGTIFEITGATLFFTGMLVWQRKQRTVFVVLGAVGLLFFAIKAKEMTITLPAIWLAQDLLVRRPLKWKDVACVVLPGLVGVWYGLQRLLEMGSSDVTHPYYMDLRGIAMGRGFGYYFDALFESNVRWQQWSIGFAVVLILFLLMKRRVAAYFQIYVFITFLPVVFMVNHRSPFYWYIPMFGVCGLAALLTREISSLITSRIPEQRLAPYATVAFAALCLGMYFYSSGATRSRRLWQQGIASDYRGFVESVQALPTPQPGGTLYFTSLPDYFDVSLLKYTCQFALWRTDIDAKLVSEK
jgi:hypothetical protein